MKLENTFIPYGLYWSSPFARWQGTLAEEHSLSLVASCTRRFLGDKGVPSEAIDGFALGVTVPQRQGFYGAPWVAGMAGLAHLDGPTLSQACATSVATLAFAARAVELAERSCFLAVTADRTSNGPHVYYPSRAGPGGRGVDRQAHKAQCLAAAAGVKGGLRSCRYVYSITERGRAWLDLRGAGWRRQGRGSWRNETGAAVTAPVRELIGRALG